MNEAPKVPLFSRGLKR